MAAAKSQSLPPVAADKVAAVSPPQPELLARIEHYSDEEPTEATGYSRYFNRVKLLRNTQPDGSPGEIQQWGSVGFDSVTSMDILARNWYKYVLNPPKDGPLGLHDTRPWRAGATDTLEENLYSRVGGWRTNVCVIAHINEDKDEVDGSFVRNPAAPGRLTKRLPPGYNEMYHMYGAEGEKGEDVRALQTGRNNKFNAGSTIHAPNPCWPEWGSLWQGWPADRERPWVHCLVYGEPFIGKSQFFATWPKPLLVFMFDGIGKDVPYLRLGNVGWEGVDEFGTFVQEIVAA